MKTRILVLALLSLLALGTPAFAGRLESLTPGTICDLFSVDYNAAEDYYLIVGDGVYRYDQFGFVQLAGYGIFYAVDWRPQGDYALLVGDNGIIYRFDGNAFTQLSSPTMAPLYDVQFSPSGDQAVIVGYDGAVLVYENGAIGDHSIGIGHALEGVTWKPDGSCAYIIGIYSFASEEIVCWDRLSATIDWTGPAVWPGDITFHPTDGYALIVEDWGHAATWDGINYQPIPTGFEQKTDGLNSAEWSPDGSMALITGAWCHWPGGIKTFVEYNGTRFNVLRMSSDPNFYEDLSWKSDSSEALVVGREGQLALYHTDVSVMGAIYFDAETYYAGDPVTGYLDLTNPGDVTPIDAYISVTIDYGNTYWWQWPNFNTWPKPFSFVVPADFHLSKYPFFQGTAPAVAWSKLFSWDLWITAPGQPNYDYLYSKCSFDVTVEP